MIWFGIGVGTLVGVFIGFAAHFLSSALLDKGYILHSKGSLNKDSAAERVE